MERESNERDVLFLKGLFPSSSLRSNDFFSKRGVLPGLELNERGPLFRNGFSSPLSSRFVNGLLENRDGLSMRESNEPDSLFSKGFFSKRDGPPVRD
jgi:hypothetical protein